MLKYTDEQLEVSRNRDDRLLVGALAGTGKTEAVALRVCALVDEGVDPKDILTVCFTRSARAQLARRLKHYGLREVPVRTLGSVAYSLVKARKSDPLFKFRIGDGREYMACILEHNGLEDSESQVNRFSLMVDSLRSAMEPISVPEGIRSADDARTLFDQYQKVKESRGYLDFRDCASVAARLATPVYEEVLVDEAQDLTPESVKLVCALTKKRLVWVGDEHQSIFAFAGVQDDLFSTVSDWSQLSLSESFRSGESLLHVPNRLLPPPGLRSSRPGGTVEMLSAEWSSLGESVVKRLAASTGSRAVLGATRYQLAPVARALVSAGHTVSRSWVKDGRTNDHAISLSTVHAAKGSEWDTVVLLDSFVEVPSLEDRRLFYVGTTRARDELILHSTDGRLPWEVSVDGRTD